MKDRRVLLVFPDISERSWHKGYFHYGLAHISSYLKQKIEDIEIALLNVRDRSYSQADFFDSIREFHPHIIGFTATSQNFPMVQKIAKWIKDAKLDMLTVCGGVHVTINPKEALLSSELDVVVCGDGEYAMEVLVNEWIEHGKIPNEKGIWYRDDGRIVNNGLGIVPDLEVLPDPDWELFDYLSLDEGSQGIGGLMLSRGCPYQCTYCCNHKIANIYREGKTRYVRFKSVDKSIREIKNFIGRYPEIHTLYFDDDILPLYRDWFFEFAERYKREVNKPYWCNIRPNLVNEKTVDAFVYSGCIRTGIGIESGNDYIRNKILKRNISEHTLVKAATLLKERGIYVHTYNMAGLPTELKNELLDTIRLNAKLNVDKIQCAVFYPYKHTELYDFVVKNGLIIKEKSLIEYPRESILKFSFAQKNRIYFTILTIELITKAYRVLPGYLSDIFLRILYSPVSAALLLPLVNMLLRKILASKKLAVKIRELFRMIIPPPPTAITRK